MMLRGPSGLFLLHCCQFSLLFVFVLYSFFLALTFYCVFLHVLPSGVTKTDWLRYTNESWYCSCVACLKVYRQDCACILSSRLKFSDAAAAAAAAVIVRSSSLTTIQWRTNLTFVRWFVVQVWLTWRAGRAQQQTAPTADADELARMLLILMLMLTDNALLLLLPPQPTRVLSQSIHCRSVYSNASGEYRTLLSSSLTIRHRCRQSASLLCPIYLKRYGQYALIW